MIDQTNYVNNTNIDSFDLNQLADNLFSLVSKERMDSDDKLRSINILKRLEEYSKPISYEWLTYLFYTATHQHPNVVDLIGSNYLNSETKKPMRKIKKILKSACNLTVTPVKVMFKQMKGYSMVSVPKVFHFLNFM